MKTISGILALALLSGAGLADDGRQEQSPPPPADLAGVFGLIDNAFLGLDLLSGFALPDSSSHDCPATLTFGLPTTLPPAPDCGYDSVACPDQAGRHHTGIHYVGRGEAVAVADGTVAWVEARHPDDHGMGNNVIIKHWLPGPRCSALYSSYANLASLAVQVNDPVTRGQPLGAIDGFLHFELKAEAVTGNPWGDGRARGGCPGPNTCWGFTVGLPDRYGYVAPGRCLQRTFAQPAYRQVSGSRDYGCALKPDGTVTCWGSNGHGQATPPAGTFQVVSAGNQHACGVRSDGAVACWGLNNEGQATPPAGTFQVVSAGNQHACGVRSDGTVACWGRNNERQASPPEGAFKVVIAGYDHTCGVQSNSAVACWGLNYERLATALAEGSPRR